MFFVLHRLAQAIFGLMVAALLVFLYQKRQVAQPVVDYYELWRASRGMERIYRGEMSGQVVTVTGGDLFQVKGTDGFVYGFRLAGLEAPLRPQRPNKEHMLHFNQSKSQLTSLILSNRVRVAFTHLSESRAGVGMTYVSGTNNVNVRLLESGMAWINSNALRMLPLRDQYALLLAERSAQQQKLGCWNLTTNPPPAPGSR